jgi:hypothetical protein
MRVLEAFHEVAESWFFGRHLSRQPCRKCLILIPLLLSYITPSLCLGNSAVPTGLSSILCSYPGLTPEANTNVAPAGLTLQRRCRQEQT